MQTHTAVCQWHLPGVVQVVQLCLAALINSQSLRTERDIRKPKAQSLNLKMKSLRLLVETRLFQGHAVMPQ